MSGKEAQDFANRLVSQLERWHNEQNRGPLAKLRRGLSETTRHEACFVLGRLFGPVAVGDPVFETVAGCFAIHPIPAKPAIGNFGATMWRVMGDKMTKDDEPHARFRRLLACDSREEICRHIPHAVRLAKSRETPVPVDYRKLFEDLWWWSERVKIDWAKSYWEAPDEPEGLSLAGVGTPVPEEEAVAAE
jgi:CRISPR system Cascade subunit CasB